MSLPSYRFPIAGAFLAGALLSGSLAWHALPSEWSLPFWTTLRASANAAKYGHAVEHYAQGVVVMMASAAAIGGAACSAAVALGSRLLRKPAHS